MAQMGLVRAPLLKITQARRSRELPILEWLALCGLASLSACVHSPPMRTTTAPGVSANSPSVESGHPEAVHPPKQAIDESPYRGICWLSGGFDCNKDGCADVLACEIMPPALVVFSGRDNRILHRAIDSDRRQLPCFEARPTADLDGDGCPECVQVVCIADGGYSVDLIQSSSGRSAVNLEKGRLEVGMSIQLGSGVGSGTSARIVVCHSPIEVNNSASLALKGARVACYELNGHSAASGTQSSTGSDSAPAQSVVGLGDIDRDGVEDYCLGFPEEHGSDTSLGAIRSYSGKTQRVLYVVSGLTTTNNEPLRAFGRYLSLIADVDGDGLDDIAVAAPGYDDDIIKDYVRQSVVIVSARDGRLLGLVDAPQSDDALHTFGKISCGAKNSSTGRYELVVAQPSRPSRGATGAIVVFDLSTASVIRNHDGEYDMCDLGESMALLPECGHVRLRIASTCSRELTIIE
jgi:hypothetical protein